MLAAGAPDSPGSSEPQDRRVPAILTDLRYKRPRFGPNLDVLDGVRGLAVLIVVASHTGGFRMQGQGGVGVWLFFVLSAFLLTLPFAQGRISLSEPSTLGRYAARRVKRVLPAYYFVIVASYLLGPFDAEFLWDHIRFVRADGVWWTIPQEMLFYVLLPLLVLPHLLFGRGFAPTIALLAALGIAANLWLTEDVFTLHGNSKELPFRLGIFATGMACAFLFAAPGFAQRLRGRTAVHTIGWLAFALLIFTAPYVHNHYLAVIPGVKALPAPLGWRFAGTFGAISGAFVIATLSCRTQLLGRVFASLPLRAVGLVSFSLYLVHMHVRDKLMELGLPLGNTLFAATTIASFAVACVLYSLVERPFLSLRR